MSNAKSAILATMYAMAASDYTNHYEGLPETSYKGDKSYERKTQLNKKQKKSRAAAKRAKQSRKRNR